MTIEFPEFAKFEVTEDSFFDGGNLCVTSQAELKTNFPLLTFNKMPKIHPTAIIEENVQIGEGTSVWDNVHIRHGATIGENCIVGEKTYIAYDVRSAIS